MTKTTGSLACPPRFGTPRNPDRLTLGGEVAAVARRLGLTLMPWQQHVADVGGLAVHIGSRVSSLAGPGEVLVSGTVRDLVVGSGHVLSDRGEHELKGVPGSWRIYGVAA